MFLHPFPRRWLIQAALALSLSAGGAWLHGQVVITSVTTSFTTGTNVKDSLVRSNVNVNGDTLSITQFKDSGGNVYTAGTLAAGAEAIIQTDATSTGELDQTTAWYMGNKATSSGAKPATLYSGYDTSTSSLLLGNNVLQGSYGVFANSSTTSANEGNIERLDILFNGTTTATTATDTQAIGIFNLGTSANFSIAVITGVDTNGNPTSYGGNLINVPATDFTTASLLTTSNIGTAPILNATGGTPTDYLLRYDSSTNLATGNVTADTTHVTSNLSGVVFTMADLGITSGTTIYGYSLMAGDVTDGGSVSNLVNYSNSTYYPTNTPDTEAFNPAAFNGVIFTMHVAPEPSAYAEVFLAAGLALYGWKRRPRRQPR